MGKLNGKIALVTGASKGIGKGIAIELANNGANVVINYSTDKEGALDTKSKIEELGKEALIVKADVGNFEEVKKMFNTVNQYFKRIDILINNAAIAIWKPFELFTEQDWDVTLDTNLKSIFLCTKLSLPSMKKNGGGIIINIGSVAGYGYLDCLVPYCASKGGVNLITKSLAVELAKYNIRVNCVSPGTIEVERNFNTDPNFPNNWLSYIPQGRVGKVKDIVGVIILLCSSDAEYITGQTIYVDGGLTGYIAMPKSEFAK